MNKEQIIATIAQLTAEKKYGQTKDGAYILDDAHHACIPDQPETWKADAVKIEGELVTIGYAYWDFEGVEKDEEDAGSWDWSNSTFEGRAGPYDLNEATDRESIAYELHIGR
jgi:hypothetical protein